MKTSPMDKHEDFIFNTLLPAVVKHAIAAGTSSEEAAMAAFLALGTVLQSRGFSDGDLMAAIKASKFGVYPEPEAMQ